MFNFSVRKTMIIAAIVIAVLAFLSSDVVISLVADKLSEVGNSLISNVFEANAL